MISKKRYQEAVKIIQQYEKEQEENKLLLDLAAIKYQMGTFVVSRLNTEVSGTVKDYGMWSDKVQLICEHSGQRVKMLEQNAEIVKLRLMNGNMKIFRNK